jgi:hypothetical protein
MESATTKLALPHSGTETNAQLFGDWLDPIESAVRSSDPAFHREHDRGRAGGGASAAPVLPPSGGRRRTKRASSGHERATACAPVTIADGHVRPGGD